LNEYGYWILGLAVAYTAILIILGNVVKRKAVSAEGFWVGGRSFKPWMVGVCITGLFSGSTFIAVMELSYIKGVSAAWYGVAEMTHILIIAALLGLFHKKMKVTVSGLIGEHFGRLALGVGGAITAFTFPMFSVATTLAFASAISAFTSLPLTVTVTISAVLLLVYLQAGGMWSVVVTQTANSVVFLAMFLVGLFALFIKPGLAGFMDFAVQRPEMFDPTNVGLQIIIAWFATFFINILLAQACLQMTLSCRTVEEGRKGLLMAVGGNIIFVVLGVAFGVAAAIVVPGGARGMIQVPLYLAQVLPAPLVGVFFLGVWACALGWGAPCQFSGATSLGRDVMGAVNPAASDEKKVFYTKISLVALTIIMIGFSLLRSDQAAWWNILGWTLRNGATFAPVVAALFWPMATARAAIAAMAFGFLGGLIWYYLGDWHPAKFFMNIHPAFPGMTVNILTMIVFCLIEQAGKWQIGGKNISSLKKNIGIAGGLVSVGTLIYSSMNFALLTKMGLLGLALFAIATGLFVMVVTLVVMREEKNTAKKIV